MLNSSWRSWNWPWMSPQTVTGALIGWTLDSRAKISFALEQRALIWSSESFLHWWSWVIQSSRLRSIGGREGGGEWIEWS